MKKGPFYLIFAVLLLGSAHLSLAQEKKAKDGDMEKYLCTIRYDLYNYSCSLFGVSDTTITNSLDSLSLSGIRDAVKQGLKSDSAKTDSAYKLSLDHLQKVISMSKPIDGLDYSKDYSSLISIITSVLSYAKTINGVDTTSINKMREVYLRRAAYAIVESRAYSVALLDSLTAEAFVNSFPNGLFAGRFQSINKDPHVEDIDSCSQSKDPSNDEKQNISSPSEKGGDSTSNEELDTISHKLRIPLLLIILIGGISAVYYYYVLRKRRASQVYDNPVNDDNGPVQPISERSFDGLQRSAVLVENTVMPLNLPSTIHKPTDVSPKVEVENKDGGFVFDDGACCVIGSSVIGKNHIAMHLPCQDSCGYEKLGKGWGIAVTSDGAGSAEHSEVGSKVIVLRTIDCFKNLLETKGWIDQNYNPSDAEWTQASYLAMKTVRDDLSRFAVSKGVVIKSLNATLIVVIHTPFGLLSSHIGDGRAGYKNERGEWKSLITPHKGEEANQTIFVTSDFWDIPNYVMSGVMVPESRVIRESVVAFTLMSDGCESTSWLYNQFDEKAGKFYDPNLPFPSFFNSLVDSLEKMHLAGENINDRLDKWNSFLRKGGKFANEPDDKTMVLGILLK